MEVQHKETDIEEILEKKPKDRSKIYFFIIAFSALLATNLYFYIKYRSSGEKLYTVTLQKENLQIELDRLEAELDNFYTDELFGSEDIQAKELQARHIIAEIRESLEDNEMSEEDLLLAKQQVSGLRDNVTKLKGDVIDLRVKNELLRKENEKLSREIAENQDKILGLQSENNNLENKVSVASHIKVSNIHLSGIEISKRGKVSLEGRAKRIDKMQINFSIVDNPLTDKGEKDVYVRIINPQGNLIADADNIFYVHGEKLQYTMKQEIDFTNNGEEYAFFWTDPNGFKKGAYTILLYSDNSIMGRSSIVLK